MAAAAALRSTANTLLLGQAERNLPSRMQGLKTISWFTWRFTASLTKTILIARHCFY